MEFLKKQILVMFPKSVLKPRQKNPPSPSKSSAGEKMRTPSCSSALFPGYAEILMMLNYDFMLFQGVAVGVNNLDELSFVENGAGVASLEISSVNDIQPTGLFCAETSPTSIASVSALPDLVDGKPGGGTRETLMCA